MFGLSRKTFYRSAMILLIVCIASGCASNQKVADASSSSEQLSYTDRYVWHVEQAARRNNVQVFWVNPPRRDNRKSPNKD